MYEHILLEVYCGLNFYENVDSINMKCFSNHRPSYACIEKKCPHATCTTCENALCYIGSKSLAERLIAFGEADNENDIASMGLWKTIAMKKMNEAYDEYLHAIGIDPTLYPLED